MTEAREAIVQGHRMVMLVAPCGAGKTVVALETLRLAVAKGKRGLFLCHTEEILDQTSRRMSEAGIAHGVIKAGHRPALDLPVQIASVQTLVRRLSTKPAADLVIPDEAHHVGARTWGAVLEAYPKAVILGMTATPFRTDGQGFRSVGFSKLIVVATIPELITKGYLVPAQVWGAPPIDLSSVETVAGDFARGQLGAAMDRPHLVGNVVAHWERLAAGRQTLVFGSSIQHSKNLATEFTLRGHAAEHIDGKSERAGAINRFRARETRILTTYGLLNEGADFPECSAVVLARPTMSRGLMVQMSGRGMRADCDTCDGTDAMCLSVGHKRTAILIDHAGNHMRHGFIDEPEVFTLDGREKRVRDAVPSLRTCLQCFAVSRSSSPKCELCGEPFPVVRHELKTIDGELTEITAAQRWAQQADDSARVKSLAKWMKIAADKKYSVKWPLVRYRALFHQWPCDAVQRKAEEMVRT